MFVIQFIQFMKKEGEHSNSLRNIFVFANEVFNKNYINISVAAYSKFLIDWLYIHTSP